MNSVFSSHEAPESGSGEAPGFPEEAPGFSGDGDEGGFSREIRNLIVTLMKSGCLTAADDEALYGLYLRNRRLVNGFLANINLRTVLDETEGILYIGNLVREEEEPDAASGTGKRARGDSGDSFLITPRRLSAFDSVVLLLLREYYHRRLSEGETTIVMDVDQLEDLLVPFFSDFQAGSRKDRMKTNGALRRFQERRLIRILTSSEGDRIRINPIIRTVISLDFLHRQLEAYREFYAAHGVSVAGSSEDEADSGDDL
ncbi:DUF4194 domain-containing protein [Succinimonas amylolytica]|uniref:DUF4194 domain-containing protein n=1 Tax=Succinimonas amylolytica TaxID=83769 RepID=UPI0023A7CEE5